MVDCYFLLLCFPLSFCLVDHGQPSKVNFPFLELPSFMESVAALFHKPVGQPVNWGGQRRHLHLLNQKPRTIQGKKRLDMEPGSGVCGPCLIVRWSTFKIRLRSRFTISHVNHVNWGGQGCQIVKTQVGWVKADTKAIQAIGNHIITHNPRWISGIFLCKQKVIYALINWLSQIFL